MSLHITDTRMTSDLCADVAELQDGRWLVTGYPGRTFDRNQAIAALILAEVLATDPSPRGRMRLFVRSWCDELGIPERDGPHGPTA
ncbi:hypothetical protein ABZ297_36470 [Nonomuraea sp. NPDC005983]|uniref:hypothetical protein n=1 Tax=Nonomuraea sp. NPDC005983 TaxID=3155595 RepID=UPI0033A1F86F